VLSGRLRCCWCLVFPSLLCRCLRCCRCALCIRCCCSIGMLLRLLCMRLRLSVLLLLSMVAVSWTLSCVFNYVGVVHCDHAVLLYYTCVCGLYVCCCWCCCDVCVDVVLLLQWLLLFALVLSSV